MAVRRRPIPRLGLDALDAISAARPRPAASGGPSDGQDGVGPMSVVEAQAVLRAYASALGRTRGNSKSKLERAIDAVLDELDRRTT